MNAGTLEAADTAALPGYATPGKITASNGAMLAVSAGGNGWTATDISALLSSNSGGFSSGSIFGFDTSGGSLTYDANIVGSIGLDKLGGYALILSGSNTYSGGTVVEAGTLILDSGAAIGTGTCLIVGANASSIFNAAAADLPEASTISPVPEPSTWSLFAAALIAGLLIGYQRRPVATASDARAGDRPWKSVI